MKLVLFILCLTAAAWADRPAAQALKQQGDAALAAGKRADAQAAYEKAIAADPTYTDAYDAVAPIWFGDKDYDVAVAMFKKAVAADAKYAAGWYNLGFAYRKLQHWQDAVDAYGKFSALKPDEPDPYFGVGMSEKALGQVGPAEAALQRYIDLEKRPDKSKFVDEARATLTELKGATTGEDAAALEKEGDDLRAKGDLAGAEDKYRAAIAREPKFEPAHNELGTMLEGAGNTDGAIGEFQQAVALAPGDDVAWYNLAHAERKANRHKDAAAAYQKYIALKPENPDPYYGLAQSLLALGDDAGARDALTRYLNLEKRPEQQKFVEKARAELASLQPAPGRATDAPMVPSSVPPSTSNDPHVKAGDALFASHEYFKAAGEYRQADPTDEAARYRLGVALAASNDLPGAIAAWELALLDDPNDQRARRDIELARRRLATKGAELDDATAETARARSLVDDRRFLSAIAVLGRVLAEPAHANDPDALALRADARAAAGDADGALADWAAEVAVRPRAPRAYRALAEGALARSDAAHARYWFDLFFVYADDDPAETKLVAAERKKAASL